MLPYRLPLKFIGLWVLNLVVLLILGNVLGINDFLIHTLHISVNKGLTTLYLATGAILAGLEDWFIDKLKGNA